MGLFFRRSASSQQEPAVDEEVSARPSLFQQLTGTGAKMEVWGKERNKVTKEYRQQVARFQRQQYKRAEDFEENFEKQKEKFFRRAGLSELASRPPTEEEMKQSRVKYFVKEFEDRERLMRKSFGKGEHKAREQLRGDYQDKLRDVSSTLRVRGPQALQQEKSGSLTVGRHLFGRSSSSSKR